jgi:hypothetical protein
LGATPERLAPANITARRQHLPNKKTYKLTCPCCNFYASQVKKNQVVQKCDKKYNDNFKLIWNSNNNNNIYNDVLRMSEANNNNKKHKTNTMTKNKQNV